MAFVASDAHLAIEYIKIVNPQTATTVTPSTEATENSSGASTETPIEASTETPTEASTKTPAETGDEIIVDKDCIGSKKGSISFKFFFNFSNE